MTSWLRKLQSRSDFLWLQVDVTISAKHTAPSSERRSALAFLSETLSGLKNTKLHFSQSLKSSNTFEKCRISMFNGLIF